jgi:hypothetical protein
MNEDSADQIRRRMAEVRSQVKRDVGQVADATRSATDWREYVKQYPWLVVGTGALAGYLLVPNRVTMVANHQGTAGVMPAEVVPRRRGSAITQALTSAVSTILMRRAVSAVDAFFVKQQQRATSRPTSNAGTTPPGSQPW